METELLLKYIKGDCTDTEKVSVTNWVDADPVNMKEYLALRKLYDLTIWQTFPITKLARKPKEKISGWSWKPVYTEAIKIAAVSVAAIFISQFLISESKTENLIAMQTLHVPAGQRAEVTLEDGTKVWLNAKTTLTFPNQFSDETREVQLDGEGFFDVIPNKSKPFIVKTDKFNIKVSGTKFNLTAYSGSKIFETALLEGSVEVLRPNNNKGVLLHPDERIFLMKNRLVISPISDMGQFLWKEGIISFDDEPFPELVDKLELYFDLKIEVENNEVLSYRCTGKFRTKDGIEHILKVLQLRTHFNYEIDEKQNTITIK